MKTYLNKKNIQRFVVFISLLAILIFLYGIYISSTRIALVNYQDFQMARVVKANDSNWLSIEKLDKSATEKFTNYDVIYIFGRGLSLTPNEVSAFKSAGDNGSKIVVEASSNPSIDVTNIEYNNLNKIKDYFRYGGEFNYQQLLRFSRTILDNKTFGVETPEPAKEISTDVLFHKDEDKVFTKVGDYLNYYQTLKSYKPEGKKVALLTSVPGPFNANRDHLNTLIDQLELAGMQVYPISSFTKRLDFIKAINPDAVLMMPHGRMQLGRGQQTIDYLKTTNIPLFAPLSVFEHHDKWLKNPQGYSANLLTMNIVLPELDGAIVPYAINAQFDDENNFNIFKAIPNRVNNFIDIIQHWFLLKDKVNEKKKLAIVYFRGPGKNALVAGNMEVTPSLYNTLKNLKKQGYNLGNLPDNYKDFKADLNRQGAVMAPYAQGLLEQFFQSGKPALVDANIYNNWCHNQLAKGLCQQVEKRYGKAPGEFMTTTKDGKEFLAVARLQYGNIALLPQPLPGLGKDTFKLVHGTQKAPPHSYLATYMWIKEVFKANAIMHYGTHGSLEFTQGKQVALSQYDWADALIGETPHFYVYTMSNVGEAIIAKRRSYATILSHLTPPFNESGLYSDLKQLSDRVDEFQLTQGGGQLTLQQVINGHINNLDLTEDLQLTEVQLTLPLNEWKIQVFNPLSQWIETIAQAKITKGLYTLGHAFNRQEAEQTAALMALDSLMQSYLNITTSQGVEVGNEAAVRVEAKQWITRLFNGESSEKLLSQLLGSIVVKRSEVWFKYNKEIDQSEVIKGFIAMSGKNKAQAASNLSTEELMILTASVISNEENKVFIAGMENEQSFAHISKAIDPNMADKAKLLAKFIPAIGRALSKLEQPEIRQLIIAMQEQDVRKQVLGWLESDVLNQKIIAQKKKKLAILTEQMITKLPSIFPINKDDSDWRSLTVQLNNLVHFNDVLIANPELLEKLSESIQQHTHLDAQTFVNHLAINIQTMSKQLAAKRSKEQQLAESVSLFKTSLSSVVSYREHLLSGASNEFNAINNGLSGGYIEPSSGGDPILNPSALPTGRNMYAIDAEKTPSVAAWTIGKKLAETLLATHLEKTGKYPEKVSFTLWPSEFIHTQGATVAEILYLLGVEPVRDPFKRIKNLKLIPDEELGRPRIDVVVQSAGQLRDLAASRLALIERAVRMVANAEEGEQINFVAKGVRDAEKYLLDKGVAPLAARTNAYRRSFGGVNGAYGTAIMSQVEQGESWNSDSDIAQQYLYNMGAAYGDSESWGEFTPHLFAAALQNTEVVIQPRSSNTWGALSLDHVYEFMGGLNLAVREVTGKDPAAYFNDYRNPNKAKLETLNQTVWMELRSTLLNPKYIANLMEGEASSAETFAETFRNTYGWNVMKPDAIDDSVWNNLHQVYIEDSHQLNVREFFEQENPYALQEMTGVMLETARKGLWKASKEQLATIAKLHTELVIEHEAGCGNFTCGNQSLQTFIKAQLTDTALTEAYQQQSNAAEIGQSQSSGLVLAKQSKEAKKSKQKTEQNIDAKGSNQVEQKPADKTTEQSTVNTDIGDKSNTLVWLWLLLLVPLSILFIRRKQNVR